MSGEHCILSPTIKSSTEEPIGPVIETTSLATWNLIFLPTDWPRLESLYEEGFKL